MKFNAPKHPSELPKTFEQLRKLPGGTAIFSRFLGFWIPYTGTLPFSILSLKPGDCVVELMAKKRVMNHLGSVHAMAIANLGELASGLASLSATAPSDRGILIDFSIQYHKKAKGSLTAHGFVGERTGDEQLSSFEIWDLGKNKVAEGKAVWKL